MPWREDTDPSDQTLIAVAIHVRIKVGLEWRVTVRRGWGSGIVWVIRRHGCLPLRIHGREVAATEGRQ
jgi:hypothetical protein